MFRLQIGCWFLFVTEVLTATTKIYTPSEHSVHEFELRAIIIWDMYNRVYYNINVYRWDLCNILLYFHVVYFTTLLFVNVIICQKLWLIKK